MKIKVVVVSKDDKVMLNKDFSKSKHIVSYSEVLNNTMSIASVYNEKINEFTATDDDFIIFIHADATLDTEGLFDSIETVKSKYDIIGLCGTSILNVSQCPLNWFTGSAPRPDTRWGCVTHGELGNKKTFFSESHPDVTDHEVACIDGVCIAMSRKAVKSGLRFDENLAKYDFYDTDLCYQAMMNYNLVIGVVVRQDLMHYSVGRSITQPQFLLNELNFRNKWKLPIPDKIVKLVNVIKAQQEKK